MEFFRAFGVDSAPEGSLSPGLSSLREVAGGRVLRSGLYRVFSVDEVEEVGRMVSSLFSEYRNIEPIGSTWIGNVFALTADSPDVVLLFDPGAAEVYDTGVNIDHLHDRLFVENAEGTLLSGFFEDWREISGVEYLSGTQIAGYDVPLFMGGQDTVENLSTTDLAVYWSLTAQLFRSVS